MAKRRSTVNIWEPTYLGDRSLLLVNSVQLQLISNFSWLPFYLIMAKQQELKHINPKEFEAECKDYAPDPNEDYMVF